MIEVVDLFHYGTISLVVSVNSIGVGIGEGLTGKAALEAINIQPQARNEITKTAILGMALIETAAIISFVVAMLLLFETAPPNPQYANLAKLGIAIAIGFPGFLLGLVSASPARQACFAIARQPFFAQKILRFMLVTQSIIQTPIIFGFIIAMFIKDQAAYAQTLNDSLRLIASGLAIGLGSVGPAIALAHFAKTACKSLGVNRKAYGKIFSFTLLSQAIIETPIIFAFIISLLLIILKPTTVNPIKGLAFLASALCIGLGTIGPGISSGRVAAAACKEIAHTPEADSQLRRISILGQGIIDTCAIYALLIALLLLFA